MPSRVRRAERVGMLAKYRRVLAEPWKEKRSSCFDPREACRHDAIEGPLPVVLDNFVPLICDQTYRHRIAQR